MEQQKLTPEQAGALLLDAEDRLLMKWYHRWRESRLGYSIAQPLRKIPLVLLVWVITNWKTGVRQFLDHPVDYSLQRLPFLILFYLLLAGVYYFRWRQKAFEYRLRSLERSDWPQPDEDGLVAIEARKAALRVGRLYRLWGPTSRKLVVFFALLTTILGMLPLMLFHAVSDGRFVWQDFVDLFEGGYSLMLAIGAIYLLGGSWLGYSIWNEIRQNHQRLSSSTLARER